MAENERKANISAKAHHYKLIDPIWCRITSFLLRCGTSNANNINIHYKNSHFLAKKWLKLLKIAENPILRQWHTTRGWLTPIWRRIGSFPLRCGTSNANDINIHCKNNQFLAKKWLRWLKAKKIQYLCSSTSPKVDSPLHCNKGRRFPVLFMNSKRIKHQCSLPKQPFLAKNG